MSAFADGLSQLRRYPSAVAGMLIIAALLGVAGYALVAIPYGTALELWRGGAQWQQHPVNARPAWVNWFRAEALPPTIRVVTDPLAIDEERYEGARQLSIPLDFDYEYREFPSELNLFVDAGFRELEPFVRLTWHTPDGRAIPLGARRVSRARTTR